jgi:hypothetical protein
MLSSGKQYFTLNHRKLTTSREEENDEETLAVVLGSV